MIWSSNDPKRKRLREKEEDRKRARGTWRECDTHVAFHLNNDNSYYFFCVFSLSLSSSSFHSQSLKFVFFIDVFLSPYYIIYICVVDCAFFVACAPQNSWNIWEYKSRSDKEITFNTDNIVWVEFVFISVVFISYLPTLSLALSIGSIDAMQSYVDLAF